jgi:hypothetical protein
MELQSKGRGEGRKKKDSSKEKSCFFLILKQLQDHQQHRSQRSKAHPQLRTYAFIDIRPFLIGSHCQIRIVRVFHSVGIGSGSVRTTVELQIKARRGSSITGTSSNIDI